MSIFLLHLFKPLVKKRELKDLEEKIKAQAVNLKLLKNSSAAPQGKLPI